jgi:hypothetical protein
MAVLQECNPEIKTLRNATLEQVNSVEANALQRWTISQGKPTCFGKPKNGEEEVNKR